MNYFALCKGIWIPKSWKFLLVESGIRAIFGYGIRNPGLWNLEYSVFNPYTLVVLLSFKFHLLSLLSYRYCSFVSLYRQKLCLWQFFWDRACLIRTLASHAGVFRGARLSSLPTNACSTEDNIPFPSLANHIVLSKFWKVDLDRRVIW